MCKQIFYLFIYFFDIAGLLTVERMRANSKDVQKDLLILSEQIIKRQMNAVQTNVKQHTCKEENSYFEYLNRDAKVQISTQG